MSIVNMLVAARTALADRRDRNRMHEELAALDDHSLVDIGLHRSQLSGMVESLYESVELDAAPPAVEAPVMQSAPAPVPLPPVPMPSAPVVALAPRQGATNVLLVGVVLLVAILLLLARMATTG